MHVRDTVFSGSVTIIKVHYETTDIPHRPGAVKLRSLKVACPVVESTTANGMLASLPLYISGMYRDTKHFQSRPYIAGVIGYYKQKMLPCVCRLLVYSHHKCANNV